MRTPERAGLPAPQAGGTERLRLSLGNGFDLRLGNGDRIELGSRKAQAIFAFIALSGTAIESRERVAGVFWSESDGDHARGSLRQCLKQLRDNLEAVHPGIIDVGRQDIRVRREVVDIDLELVTSDLGKGVLSSILALGLANPDRIMAGFEDLDREFASWLTVCRQQWRKTFIGGLERILRDPASGEKIASEAAHALLDIDPTHEEAYRVLILQQALRGNIAAALKLYGTLWDLLQNDYDMEPSDETQRLIVDIKKGSVDSTAQPSAMPVMEPSRLPIIEVDRLSPGLPEGVDDYVVHGFRSELIANLVRFREWIVVEPPDAQPEAGAPQQVDYRLSTAFRHKDDDLLIVVSLTELTRKRSLWSETFSLALHSWMDQQRQIARRVSATLDIHISANALSRQIGDRDFAHGPYIRWLRGQYLRNFWEPQAEFEAEALFKEVIRDWPSFAPAYSGLANIYNSRHIILPGVRRDRAMAEEALTLARRAAELDPLDARGHLTLAWSYMMTTRYPQADLHLEMARDLNPSNPSVLVSAAQGFAFVDRTDVALDLMANAFELNPLVPPHHWAHLAGIRFLHGDIEGCVEAADRAGQSIFNIPAWKAAALGRLGDTRRAQEEAHLFLRNARDAWHAETECTDAAIVEWFLSSFPIRNVARWRELREGLILAGLPASDVGEEQLYWPHRH
ncbi:BTAD domain-containing putative transcriptional regulator [Inquilinus sp. NPDC058860]|uniref:BTAD domain-containing putative transcriptional regulator n=1 Tax=Inquilinus sp. NPDC058860 TaxID=3346652 RepID=UPI00368CEA4F